ncbi:MAG: NAD(P)-binding domain-containing protein [Ktedonobacteraceae bacterium]
MNIGVIGAGNIGKNAARLFANAGHQVAISTSKEPETIQHLAAELGANVRATSADEAVIFGDVILLAVPWTKRHALPPASLFAGKIVIDALNAYGSNFQIENLGNSTSSEEIAKQLPGARIVKAFNTMYFETLRTGARVEPEQRLVLFVASDDAEAKQVVSGLIEEIGFTPVDTGSLREGGRRQEPGSPIYNKPMARSEARQRLADL